jgi:hypothetical protein
VDLDLWSGFGSLERFYRLLFLSSSCLPTRVYFCTHVHFVTSYKKRCTYSGHSDRFFSLHSSIQKQVLCMFYVLSHYVILNSIPNNKWTDLKKPAVRLKVTVGAVLDLRTLFEEHVLLFFFDSLEVHFCPEKIWAHPLKKCPIQASLV